MTKHKQKSVGSPSKGGGNGSGKGKGKVESYDLKDVPLNLPQFSLGESLPRFGSVLKRSDQDGIGMEDLDPLQLELEAHLASTVLRKMALKQELKIVANIEKHIGTKNRKVGSPGKRSGKDGNDGKSSKRFKSMSGKPVEVGNNGNNSNNKIIGLPKFKSDSSTPPSFDPLENEQIRPLPESTKPFVPKNETPNRFWSFVEPYCAPITSEDIKLLEDLIKTHNDLSEYYRVPPLGQHYATRWALEDMDNEKFKSSSNANDNNGGSEKMLKKGGESQNSAFGELTNRLVGGLMEENVMTSIDESIEAAAKNNKNGNNDEDKSNLIRSLNITNSDSLEARVRKELEEQGILDPTESKQGGPDEIFEDLNRCQTELKAVSGHNLSQLNRLLKAAKEEMVRQELRNKLNVADTEVMEAYKKISIARSKKKPVTKKEREFAWKALKERELIIKQLESV